MFPKFRTRDCFLEWNLNSRSTKWSRLKQPSSGSGTRGPETPAFGNEIFRRLKKDRSSRMRKELGFYGQEKIERGDDRLRLHGAGAFKRLHESEQVFRLAIRAGDAGRVREESTAAEGFRRELGMADDGDRLAAAHRAQRHRRDRHRQP